MQFDCQLTTEKQTEPVTFVVSVLETALEAVGSRQEIEANHPDRLMFRVAMTMLIALRAFTTKGEFDSILRFIYSIPKGERLSKICAVLMAYEGYHKLLLFESVDRFAAVIMLDPGSALTTSLIAKRLRTALRTMYGSDSWS